MSNFLIVLLAGMFTIGIVILGRMGGGWYATGLVAGFAVGYLVKEYLIDHPA